MVIVPDGVAADEPDGPAADELDRPALGGLELEPAGWPPLVQPVSTANIVLHSNTAVPVSTPLGLFTASSAPSPRRSPCA